MHVTSFIVDALGVVTIFLVAVLVLLGLFCVLYSFYFRNRILNRGFVQLGYFSGPWIIRITLIFFAVWWGFWEIIRLNLLRRKGRLLNALNTQWQERVCKSYIVSNLGFAEPCLFLVLIFLLRASLQKSGTLNRKWNWRTVGFVLLCCLPIFALQLVIILIGPEFNKEEDSRHKLPPYFTRIAVKSRGNDDMTLCTYPLLSILLLGLFATILTAYLFLLGRQILHLVINKFLQKRVYALIFSVAVLFPLRVLFLGLSVRFWPETVVYEALAFLAFLSLFCCIGAGVCLLVYFPVADSLALGSLQRDIEARRRISDEHNDTVSLIANQGPHSENTTGTGTSTGRNSAASTKRGSISFRATERDETSAGTFVELSPFSPNRHSTPTGSPKLLGWPMLPPPPSVAEAEVEL